MSREQPKGKTVNEGGPSDDKDAPVTQPRSGPVRYELIDKDGNMVGTDSSAAFLADMAKARWPEQAQDPDRTGCGWDIQTIEAK